MTVQADIVVAIARQIGSCDQDFQVFDLPMCGPDDLQGAADEILSLRKGSLSFMIVSGIHSRQFRIFAHDPNGFLLRWIDHVTTNTSERIGWNLQIVNPDTMLGTSHTAPTYPEKMRDEVCAQAHAFLKQNRLVPEPEEPEPIDPSDYGLGTW